MPSRSLSSSGPLVCVLGTCQGYQTCLYTLTDWVDAQCLDIYRLNVEPAKMVREMYMMANINLLAAIAASCAFKPSYKGIHRILRYVTHDPGQCNCIYKLSKSILHETGCYGRETS